MLFLKKLLSCSEVGWSPRREIFVCIPIVWLPPSPSALAGPLLLVHQYLVGPAKALELRSTPASGVATE